MQGLYVTVDNIIQEDEDHITIKSGDKEIKIPLESEIIVYRNDSENGKLMMSVKAENLELADRIIARL